MANFFSRIYSTILGSDRQRAIGIDIGSSSIKVVQLKNENGRARLETYGALAVGPYVDKHVGQAAKLPTNTTAEALSDLLREAKTTTTKGGIALPFSSTLMQMLKLPRVGEEELKRMVPLEARKYIPTSIEEVHLDWTVVPDQEESSEDEENGEDMVSVLMVAVHKKVVERYQKIVERAGLNALFFEVEIYSTIRSIMEEDDRPVLIFDMGAASAKLYIIERGVIQKTHTVNQGSQNIMAAIAKSLEVKPEVAEILKRGMTPEGQTRDRSEEVRDAARPVVERILTEAEKFKRGWENETGQEVSRCILVGGGVRFQDFAQQTGKQLNLPTELANPFQKFKTPAFLDDVLADNGPEFAVAAGIALRRLRES